MIIKSIFIYFYSFWSVVYYISKGIRECWRLFGANSRKNTNFGGYEDKVSFNSF